MLTENPKKHHIRETLLVTDKSGKQLKDQKLTNALNNKPSQLRNAQNIISIDKVMKIPKPTTAPYRGTNTRVKPSKTINSKKPRQWDPIRNYTSHSDTDCEEPISKTPNKHEQIPTQTMIKPTHNQNNLLITMKKQHINQLEQHQTSEQSNISS